MPTCNCRSRTPRTRATGRSLGRLKGELLKANAAAVAATKPAPTQEQLTSLDALRAKIAEAEGKRDFRTAGALKGQLLRAIAAL